MVRSVGGGSLPEGRGESVDVPLTLDSLGVFDALSDDAPVGNAVARASDAQSTEDRIVQALVARGPASWVRMAATFSMTVNREYGAVIIDTGTDQVEVVPDREVLNLVRSLRNQATSAAQGQWFRLALIASPGMPIEIQTDDGTEPFVGPYLFDPADYRADIAAYPGRDVPLWLLAYAFHDGAQHRPPARAVAEQSLRSADQVVVEVDWPDLPVMWSRWAALSAVSAARHADFGPSIAPSLAVFEASSYDGSTLVRLPGDRAVLSGGLFGDPNLKAAYRARAELPNLFAGAPIWVTDATLSSRAIDGMLSFCWWYDGGRWYRAVESPQPSACFSAVPAVTSAAETVGAIVKALTDTPSELVTATANAYVAAVEDNMVTRTLVETLLPAARGFDVDAALVSLAIAQSADLT